MYRRLLIAAFLAGVAFFAAHLINLVVAHALTKSVGVRRLAPTTVEHQSPDVNRLQLAEEILASGLFGRGGVGAEKFSVRMNGNGVSAEEGTTLATDPPIEASKKVKLIGTVIGSGKGGHVVLEDMSTKRQTLYHLHEQIPNLGEIKEIRKHAVVFRKGRQQELLELEFHIPTTTLQTYIPAAASPVPQDHEPNLAERPPPDSVTSNPLQP